MALPNMGGLERSLAFTALIDRGMPAGPDDVTALLESYSSWLELQTGFRHGKTDLWTYVRDVYSR